MQQERRSEILEKIRVQRMIKVADLIKEYEVSMETIRRDLEYLESLGHLKRVYGGAVLHGLYGEEPEYAHRGVVNYQEKRAIGARAAELIEDGDTLFIDVGTTVLETVYCLKNKKNLTVITNAALIGMEIIKYDSCRVILLGGEMRQGELSVSGPLCEQSLKQFYANKMIMGVGGISLSSGITDYHFAEANIRRMMLDRSDFVIAVADSGKFGVTAMNAVCPVNRVNKLVTDWAISSETVTEFRNSGVDVIIAEELK